MHQSVEREVGIGQPIRLSELISGGSSDFFLSLKVNTEERIIPFYVSIEDFNTEGRRITGVHMIYAHALPHRLHQYGLAEAYRSDDTATTNYSLRDDIAEYFKRLEFSVKLPDIDKCLTAFPMRIDMVRNPSINCCLFKQQKGTGLPVFASDSPAQLQQLRGSLPALVLPPETWPLLAEERNNGFLAITPYRAYQKKIEIKFDLLDHVKTLLDDYRFVVVPDNFGGEGPWLGADWSPVFGALTDRGLQRLRFGLLDGLVNHPGSIREIEHMREWLLSAKQPTDPRTAVLHLLMFKTSLLHWAERALQERHKNRLN